MRPPKSKYLDASAAIRRTQNTQLERATIVVCNLDPELNPPRLNSTTITDRMFSMITKPARKFILLAAIIGVISSTGFAQRRPAAPETVVRALYAARKSRATDPFFQTKSRARLDKYFSKEFADLIWKDAVAANGEVGSLNFDPTYNAQDVKITGFRIKRPMYGEGNLDLADVPVTFRNFGEERTILFRLERGKRRAWKITDIFYPDNEDTASSLSKILSAAP